MNTFRNKQFKNELDPKYAFYDCLRSCEIKINSEKSLEECVENCEIFKPYLLLINLLGIKTLDSSV